MSTSNKWSLEITKRLRGSNCGRENKRFNPTPEKITARQQLITLREKGHPYNETETLNNGAGC